MFRALKSRFQYIGKARNNRGKATLVGPDPILAKHHEKEMRESYLAANLQGHDNACMQHYSHSHVENKSLQCTQPNVSASAVSASSDDARVNPVSGAHPDSTIWAEVKVRQNEFAPNL